MKPKWANFIHFIGGAGLCQGLTINETKMGQFHSFYRGGGALYKVIKFVKFGKFHAFLLYFIGGAGGGRTGTVRPHVSNLTGTPPPN